MLPKSYWAATARPGPKVQSIQGQETADVVIIGAGFTGLNAALHLVQSGARVIVVDSADIGFGASGRNGGQIIPGLKYGLEVLQRTFGGAAGQAMFAACENSATYLFDLIHRLGLDCQAEQSGFIQASETQSALATSLARAEHLQALGHDVCMLNADQTQQALGTNLYCGAYLDRRGGGLHPLSYARELARLVCEQGGRIFQRSPALGIQKHGAAWHVSCPHGHVRADQVIVATNAYTDDLWPGLRQTVLPFYSFQIATKPLGADHRAQINPGGHVLSDTRRLLSYFRTLPDGRLIFGGRGGVADARALADYGKIRNRLAQIYPSLASTDLEFYWSGQVALTNDFLPHLHCLAPGVFAGLGFNGRGVAMTSLMGRWLADLALGRGDQVPFPVSHLQPLWWHKFRKPVFQIATAIKGFQDRMQV